MSINIVKALLGSARPCYGMGQMQRESDSMVSKIPLDSSGAPNFPRAKASRAKRPRFPRMVEA
jgi:hypothetical protein